MLGYFFICLNLIVSVPVPSVFLIIIGSISFRFMQKYVFVRYRYRLVTHCENHAHSDFSPNSSPKMLPII